MKLTVFFLFQIKKTVSVIPSTMACGVRKLAIGGLSPDVSNAFIVAVVIAKQNVRTYVSKKDSEKRGVLNLTLRDSPSDTINGTVWGSLEFIQHIYQTFSTGDVVEILSPRISFKPPGGLDATFNPVVTSPFQLHLQENGSSILLYSEEDSDSIRQLIHIPTKSPGDFLRLSDLYSYGQAMKGEYVNLLVAIRNVGEIKSVKSRRDSKNLICRHVTVMDQSHLEFHITLWSEEIIIRSDFWRSRQTVIFFADIRLEWDNFRQIITANITSRTIVTENPSTEEAIALQTFAKTAPIQPTAVLDHFASNVIDVNSVNTIMTTAQVLDKAYSRNNAEEKFTALIYAMITHLNLDGQDIVTGYNCSRCLQTLDETKSCLNTECLTSESETNFAKVSFNLQINLTDHRGTLYNCRLVSPAADQILGCSILKYVKMTLEEKTTLKWRFLLTRWETRILVLTTTPERSRPLISILSCTPAKSKDLATKLPIY